MRARRETQARKARRGGVRAGVYLLLVTTFSADPIRPISEFSIGKIGSQEGVGAPRIDTTHCAHTLPMRRWSGSSPGRGRAFAPDVDWARHAGDQHPARQYVSRRERASPSRTRARRTPALESSAPAARAASPPPSASSQPPPAAPALPPRDADERAKRRSPADTAAPRRPPSSAERRGDAELAQQRADAHELNAAMADVFISSSLARSPYRSPLRDERGVGDRSPYRSPLRERGAGYRSPLRAASPSSGQSGRESPPAQRHEAALSLEPTTSSSRQPAHWKQNSAGDGQSAYRGASPRSARARSPSPVRPAVLGQRRVDGASQAAVHLDNLLHVPPPPTLLRAAASPREHEAAELFSSPTAVRHNGVPHDPYRAAKLRMSPGRSSGPQRTSTAELLATPTPRRMSSRVLADQSGQQAGQLEHSSMHFASSSSGLAATSSTPQHPAASVRYSSRRTVSPVRSASNAAAAAALHGNGTAAAAWVVHVEGEGARTSRQVDWARRRQRGWSLQTIARAIVHRDGPTGPHKL